MAPPPPPPPPPPPLPDELGFEAVLQGLSNGTAEENSSAGLPSFAAESNGMDGNNQLAMVKAPETKSWEKPLTIPEIRKSSNNWSLASDAGLLLYLQEFSQKMMTKTSDLEKQMDTLVHDAKSANSKVHNTFNDFLMLANTQFIENRVYDDSEDVDGSSSAEREKKENSTKSREQREAEVIPRVIQALTLGINVLDTGFEHLDANAGNSDSEDEDPTYKAVDPILEAKDIYAHRSLPYIIGTPAFMQDDDVGLMDLSEEEEVDDESSQDDTLSDSDKSELSDSEYSDTETESEFTGGRQKQTADTTATSTNRSESDDSDTGLFDDEDEDYQPAGEIQPPNFQDELARKLGGGIVKGAPSVETENNADESGRNRTISETSKTSHESSKKGTRRKKLPLDREKKSKKKRSPSKTEEDNLFGEQPGEEEAEDSPFGKKGLFSSSGGGLFDDDREDDGGLFDEKPSRGDVTSDHVYEDIVANPEDSKPTRKAPPGGVALFGGSGAVGDELFGGSSKTSQDGQRSLLRNRGNGKRDTQADDDLADKIEQQEPPKPQDSKSGGLFDGQEEDELFAEPRRPPPKKEAGKPKPKKQVDLFGGEDDNDLFAESKPQQQPPKKKLPAGAVNVFGGANPLGGQTEPPPREDEGDEDMYVNTMIGAHGAGRGKHNTPQGGGGGLFDNVDDDLFGAPPPRPSEKPSPKNDNEKLFADDNDEDLFAAPPPIPKDDPKATAKKNQGLFDDIEETGEDDLFATSSKQKEPAKKKPPGGVALFEGSDIFGSPPKTDAESPPQQRPDLSPQAKANRTQNTLSLFNEDEEKDEDLFAAPTPAPPPKKDQLDPISKEEQAARRRTKSKSIFDDEAILFGLKNEENPGVDLFGANSSGPAPKNQSERDEKPGSPRKRATSATKDLFADDDDDDDLFSTGSSQSSATIPRASGVKAAIAKEKKKKKAAPKGGLFGDEDEDDLFAEPKAKKKEKKDEGRKKEKKEEGKRGREIPAISVEDPLGGGILGGAGSTSPPAVPKEDPPPLPPTTPPPKQNKKPPAGAVSMFGGLDPKSFSKKKAEPEIDDDMFDNKPATIPKPAANPLFPSSPSPTTDTSPLFGSSPPKKAPKAAPKTAKKPPSPLFPPSSSSSSPQSPPLFGSSPPQSHDAPDYATVTPRIRSVAAPKTKSASAISKLQANMNIDPTALKPGAAPPHKESDESAVGFDQPAVAHTLANPTKTRARVSAKRRPPSRRSLQAAAASASNPALWSDNTGDQDDSLNAFSASLVSDEPDMGGAAAPAPRQATPPTAKKPSPVTHRKPQEPKEPPSAAAKPKKHADASRDIFTDELFGDVSNTTLDTSTSSKTRKEERPFSIDGDSEFFAPVSSANKKAPKRTVDRDEDIFSKPPARSNLDASMDDIFAAPPPMLGQSSKQSSVETDPTYEDIFAPGSDTRSKRSTLTDLAIDEDLFGDSTLSKLTDTSQISIDEDLFGVPPTPTPVAAATKTKKKKSVKKAPVLEDDDDLFAEKPKKTKTKAAKATDADLFGDQTDIFADLPAAKPKEKKKKKIAPSTEDSIFKNVRGDDIFADSPASTKPKKTKSKKKTAKEASDSIFDNDAPNIFDDPLNAITS